jgi:hypothetical protein
MLAAAAAALLLLSFGVGAQAARFSETGVGQPFDPSQCRHGSRRHVHWAAGSNVFRFPFDPANPVYARAPQEGLKGESVPGLREVPPAPDSTEPEGCERNPLRGGGVPYMRQHANALFRQLAGRDLEHDTADRFLNNGFFAFPERLRADDRNARNARWFAERKQCVPRAQGALECMEAGAAGPQDFRKAHVVRLPGAQVFAGTRLPPQDLFVVLQDDLAPPGQGVALGSSFDLFGSVRLLESWRLRPQEIDLLVPYYRGLVRYLADAHVPGYRWHPGRAPGDRPADRGKREP